MKLKSAVAIGLVITTYMLLRFDFSNLTNLWGLWLVAIGIVVGWSTSRLSAKVPGVLCLVSCAIVCMALVARALPIHSFSTSPLVGLEVSKLGHDWKFTITDAAELTEFQEYCSRGCWQEMWKSGYGYYLFAKQDNLGSGSSIYVHGNALGRMPGGYVQSVFVPAKPDFRAWFESILAKHGHHFSPTDGAGPAISSTTTMPRS
jgi:hypothetical protein